MTENAVVTILFWMGLYNFFVCGICGMYVSSEKGRSGAEGFLFGLFLGPIGVAAAACLPTLSLPADPWGPSRLAHNRAAMALASAGTAQPLQSRAMRGPGEQAPGFEIVGETAVVQAVQRPAKVEVFESPPAKPRPAAAAIPAPKPAVKPPSKTMGGTRSGDLWVE